MELQQQQAAAGQPITDAELPDRPTAREVARWLRKHPNAIYAWAKKGLIPCKKVGGCYLFDKAALLEWAKPQREVA